MKPIISYTIYLCCFCLSLVCLFLFTASCKKFVAIPPPQTQVETSQVFSDEQAAIAAVTGLYSQMVLTSLNLANGGATVYPALSADEIYNTAASADYDAFCNNNIPAGNAPGLNRLWQFGYKNIYHANAVLEGLSNSSSLTQSLKDQLKGEMLVARAFNYFYLVSLFGDLPLVTTTSFDINAVMTRSPVTAVYQLVTADLLEAKSLLKETYPSTGRTRPNKWAAAALLARVYLCTQEWVKAAEQATDVISPGMYSLTGNLNNVFLATSNETIWQVSPVSTTINTAEGNIFVPSSATARPTFALTDHLLNAFEPNDARKINWLKSNVVSSITYYYPYKYKVRTGAPPYTEYSIWLRLAEIYLLRAEARAQLNDLQGAKDDLNKIRNRAGLGNTTAVTQPDLLTAIAKERRIELFAEWGHRWIDLKRTGKINEVMQAVKGANWQSTDVLYPIPQYELDTNPFLIQNPGY